MSSRASAIRRLAALLALFLPGCAVVTERYVLEERFTDRHVETILHGRTTKQEILARLGPPAAIDNDTARFPAAAGASGVPRVYLYRAVEITFSDLCVIAEGGGCMNTPPVRRTRELRILFDERTQRVLDHVLEDTQAAGRVPGDSPWLH